MDKEAEGLVYEDPGEKAHIHPKWSAICKVCSPRPMKMTGLERAVQRSWGLHKVARFRDYGGNIFVHIGSEGD